MYLNAGIMSSRYHNCVILLPQLAQFLIKNVMLTSHIGMTWYITCYLWNLWRSYLHMIY